jgi:hypothetical protein
VTDQISQPEGRLRAPMGRCMGSWIQEIALFITFGLQLSAVECSDFKILMISIIPSDIMACTYFNFCSLYSLPNCQYKQLKSKGHSLNCLPLLSRGLRFSDYSFTTVCIQPTGSDAKLYAVLQD